MNRILLSLFLVCLTLLVSPSLAQEKAKPPLVVELADGKLQLPVSGAWKSVKPRSRIIQFEFSIPAAEGDEQAGRLTIMAAGGSIPANIARWEGQFRSADGQPLAEDAKKVEKKKIGELEVHLVDISGNFQDKPRGPFGPSVSRPNYRMLAAIVPTSDRGIWFIKSYGPKKTMDAAQAEFEKMIEGLTGKP